MCPRSDGPKPGNSGNAVKGTEGFSFDSTLLKSFSLGKEVTFVYIELSLFLSLVLMNETTSVHYNNY